jgi:hypothetical protein
MRLVALSLIGAIVVSGCANGGIGPCTRASDCPAGQICSAHACREPTPDGGAPRDGSAIAAPPDGALAVRDGCVPSAESCDGVDQDCDGIADDGDTLCPVARGEGACVDGRCAIARCEDGFADCDHDLDNGCEKSLGTPGSCGTCDRRCEGATAVCARSATGYACAATCSGAASTLCGGACVDTTSDVLHCGGCDQPCARPHASTRCTGGGCAVTACDPGWDDCDRDSVNGCETSLATTTDCGRCGGSCAAPSGCSSSVSCIEGTCAYSPTTATTVCRAAADVCDVAETCGSGLTCGADALAAPGTPCRAASCAGDVGESCTGSSAACPAACGCGGEACCDGAACGTGLACRGGTCRSCVTPMPAVSGWFSLACGKSYCTSFVGVTGTDAGLVFQANDGPGITASGSFTVTCDYEYGCFQLNAVRGEGDRITFVDDRGGSSSILLSGATASGEASFPCYDSCYRFNSVFGSGNRLVFGSGIGEVTISGVESCR